MPSLNLLSAVSKRAIISLAAVFLGYFSFVHSASAEMRGRVYVDNNKNVVADNGEALRGAPFFLDTFMIKDMRQNEALYREYFRDMSRNYKMNVVRVSPWIGKWTYMQKGSIWYENHKSDITYMVDKVIKWAEEDGIYVMLNLHTEFGTVVKMKPFQDFWDLFATKYKDHTHVIYEAINEPHIQTANVHAYDMYKYLRDRAPQTHIILWSVNDPEKVSVKDIQKYSNGIDYSNASMGWHSYETIIRKDLRWAIGNEYREAGIPSICTEFYSLTRANWFPIDYDFMMDNIKFAEDGNFSWVTWAPRANYRALNVDDLSADTNVTHEEARFSDTFFSYLNAWGIYWPQDPAVDTLNAPVVNRPIPVVSEPTPQPTPQPEPITTPELEKTGQFVTLIDQWQGQALHTAGTNEWAAASMQTQTDEWWSQQWELLQVEGKPGVFRLRNRWTGFFLHASADYDWAEVQIAELVEDWTSQMWELEYRVGETYNIKNVWTGRYLSSPEQAGAKLRLSSLREDWSSQKFAIDIAE